MYIDFIEGDELRIMREMSFHPDYMKEVTRQVYMRFFEMNQSLAKLTDTRSLRL